MTFNRVTITKSRSISESEIKNIKNSHMILVFNNSFLRVKCISIKLLYFFDILFGETPIWCYNKDALSIYIY